MKHIRLILSLIILCLGCSEDTDADLLKRDKLALVESLDAGKVFHYKFGKILIRASSPHVEETPEIKAFKADFDKIFKMVMAYNTEEQQNLSLLDYISIYRDYKKMENFVMETDEDIFPTLGEVFSETNGEPTELLTGQDKIFEQNIEHAILSAIVILSKDLGKEVSLYECSKTDPNQLPDSEVKTLLQFFRGFLFFEKGLFYLSEDEITRNITWLNANKEVDLRFTRLMFKWGNLDNASTHIGFHALNHLFRGFDRLMMERAIDEERALEDFEIFLEDSKNIGLDNELIWGIETYLYLKKEDKEKAIGSLTKLKSSGLLSSNEKESIRESIEYLKTRESGEALNGVYDKYFLSKIATKYMFSILSQIDWEQVLKDNGVPHTEEMFNTIERFEDLVERFNSYSSDETLEKAEEQLKESGKAIWDKTKSLLE